ncbi:MAG: GLUG motif-containing protein [Prolixibacteraceae bacterium]|nr:GLUG motif-containing protein [Prolixibacteraceae bacterium]
MKKYLLLTLLTSFLLTAQAQDPRWGYALQFNGTTNFATADALCARLVGKDFTIEFWFKLSGTPSDFNALAVFNPPSADVTDNRIETGVGYGADQKFYVYSPNSGTVTTYGTTTITVGTWYHVAITYTYATGNIVAYLNGQQELTKTIPASDKIQSNDRFSLGQEWDNSSRSALFHGELDEVRIWDDIRTISELNYNRYSELAGTDANLLAYYKMSDGSGTSLTDDSPNSYTGTLLNGIAWVTSTVPHPYSGGTGVSGSPYQIATAANLIYLSQHSEDWTKSFIQTANIDFGGDETLVDWNGDGTADGSGTVGFSPIGNSTTAFSGDYNGQGHTISNLYENRSNSSYQGLFGTTSAAGISNLGLINIDITGNQFSGGFAGTTGNSTAITNCYASGNVTNYSGYSGGFVGWMYQPSSISGCFASCTVSTNAGTTGGFTGGLNQPTCTLINCYSRSNVVRRSGDSNTDLAPFASANWGVITNCYSTGTVSVQDGSAITGKGFLSGNGGTVSNCFFDATTSGQTDSYATAKTTAQMKTQSTFTNWDFTTTPVWKIQSGSQISYPYLNSITYDPPGASPAVNPIPGLESLLISVTWVGGTTGATTDWNTASNWSPAVVPTATIDATIPSSGITNYPVVASGTNATVKNLINNSTVTNSIIINTGGKLTVSGSYTAVSGAKIKVGQ